MHIHRIIIISLIAILLQPISGFGQDLVFSQYYSNPVYLNPALAGNKICPRVTLDYRNQYPAFSPHYTSYCAGGDMFVEPISGGIAVQVCADRSQVFGSYSANFAYSYHLQLNRKLSLNAALQAGYYQYRLNWNKLIFEDMIVPGTGEIISGTEAPPERLSVGDVDFASGFVLGYNERLYLGAAVHHITMPDLSFYQGNTSRLDMRITVHAGALFDLNQGLQGSENEQLSFSPNILYMQQGDFHQLNAGMYVNFYPFVSGLWMRHNFENPDALIVLLGFQQPEFKIGYSYDFSLSKLGLPSGGTHELSFVWLLPCPKKEFKYKAIKCPSF